MKSLLLVVTLLSLSINSLLYGANLTGTVMGIDGEGAKVVLPKATVFWLGTDIGTVTDGRGKFTLSKTNESSKLIARYVGYEPDTLIISGKDNDIEIILKSGFTTDEINVVGKQQGTLISQSSSVKTETITSRGLVKAACCNLGESFETNPSVDVSYTDAISGAKQIKLLGLEGSYTQMLTERIPNLRGLASSFGLNYVPGPWMNSISISKGAASVIDGYESITGQINIEYKKPENLDPTFLNLYVNQMGRLEGNFHSSYEVSEELSTMLFASGNFMNNKIDMNSDTFLDLPMVKQVNLFNRWKYSGENFESMSGVKYMLEDRKGGQENYFSDKKTGYYGTTIKTNRLEAFTKNGFVFNGDRFSSIGTMLSFIHHDQKSMFGNRIYNGTQNTFFANALFQSSFDASEESHSGDEHQEEGEMKHKYIVGMSYNHDEYDEHLQDSLFRRVESVPGVYGEYTMAAIEGLSITGGLRADFHNLYGTFITPRFHAKYNFSETTVMRVSAGKGYHVANIFAENIGIIASSRKLFYEEELKPELAWNYGLNGTHDFAMMGLDFTLNAEYYYTSFVNQVIIDLDRNPGEVHVYNLNGDSYSHSFQIDLYTELYPGLEVTTAYRMNDVKMTIGGALEDKALMSNHKGFINLAYSTSDDEWMLDFTAEYNGSGRIPNTSSNPVEYRLDDEFPSFVIINAQITKKFGPFELYFGGENLTNYRQPYPILGYNDPFGQYFDSSMIWGPVAGVMIYSGFRWTL